MKFDQNTLITIAVSIVCGLLILVLASFIVGFILTYWLWIGIVLVAALAVGIVVIILRESPT